VRIDRRSGSVLVLAMASDPTRHVPDPHGGTAELPATGGEILLKPGYVRQLIDISAEIPRRFPAITDDEGKSAPADVEFGFVNDRLQLLQIRPFLESRSARGSTYLQGIDRPVRQRAGTPVNMSEVPSP
jgi:hypothetical protein